MRIPQLRWTEWNREHVRRHGIVPEEVEEVVLGDHHVTQTRGGRYLVIGQTFGGRYLSVVAPERRQFFDVTARESDPEERRLYARHRGRR